jgi:hypothetical protein
MACLRPRAGLSPAVYDLGLGGRRKPAVTPATKQFELKLLDMKDAATAFSAVATLRIHPWQKPSDRILT